MSYDQTNETGLTYDQWIAQTWANFNPRETDQRPGQWYFNCLPNRIGCMLTSTLLDPFFKNRVSEDTEMFVMEHWTI